MRLSLCMIVKDEEKNLPRCLKHIKNVVDEIIIVDTGSKDRTPLIAKELGAKVYHFKWCDDFSAARNESLRHAKGDYIIYLDADDRVSKKDAEKIAILKNSFPKEKDIAYSLRIMLPSPEGGKNSAYQVRIFPNLPDIRFEQPIHEQIVPALKKKGIKGMLTDIVIEHKGYEDYGLLRKKAYRNLNILKKLLLKDPENWFAHYFLAQTYEVLGEKDLYEFHLRKALTEDCKNQDKNWFIGASLKYSRILMEKGDIKEAEKLLKELEQEFPDNNLIKFFIAELNFKKGDYINALNYYITIDPNNLTLVTIPTPEDEMKFRYYLNMGQCNEEIQYYSMAQNAYEKAYNLAYNDELKKEALMKIISLLTKMDRLKNAVPYIKEYTQLDPSAMSYTLLALAYMKNRLYKKAEDCLKKAISMDPDYYNPKIKLAELLIQDGRLTEAKTIIGPLINRWDMSATEKSAVLLMSAFIHISEFHMEEFLIATDLLLKHIGIKAEVQDLNGLYKLYEKLSAYFNNSCRSYINGIKNCLNLIESFSAQAHQSCASAQS